MRKAAWQGCLKALDVPLWQQLPKSVSNSDVIRSIVSAQYGAELSRSDDSGKRGRERNDSSKGRNSSSSSSSLCQHPKNRSMTFVAAGDFSLLTGVVLVSTLEHTRLVWLSVFFYFLFCIIGSTGIGYFLKNSRGTSLVLLLVLQGWFLACMPQV
jgi:hypothetical protein